ncbi:MAG: hypothetical protein FJX74_08830, partial [Armatimonadetes bacterium]|nr:hypothetical protein [Armatimonadota bacterium]
AAALGEDASGHGLTATIDAGASGEGHTGLGLALDGRGGLTVPGGGLHAAQGFAVDLWVRFGTVGENTNVIAKAGEYFIRLDPPNEGNNLSFFVVAGGTPEPRVRGPIPQPGVWYHVVATWDGLEAVLWVNGQRFQQKRVGKLETSEAPVLVGGPSQYGPMGLKGTLDEVQLYNRPLTDAEVLTREYDLDGGAGPRLKGARFEFDGRIEGWETRDASGPEARDGKLQTYTSGGTARLVQRNLDVPLKGLRFLALRMAVSAGDAADVAYLTTTGLGRVPLDLIADGRMHSYVLDATVDPEWDGSLRALCLAPSDTEAKIELDFLRVSAEPEAPPEVSLEHFLPDLALSRAGRPCRIGATLRNVGGPGGPLSAELSAPAGARILGEAKQTLDRLDFGAIRELSWLVQAGAAGEAELRLAVSGGGATPLTAKLPVPFGATVPATQADYVPPPQAAESDLLVGCHYCPLWKQGSRSGGWEHITPYPEREPVLGWYDEGSPEVADWEIKWCLEHGIDFFVYCWYRASQGKPVEQFLGHAIHEGLFNARYEKLFQWCIMWENQSRGTSGIASEEDLLQNLLPFWIEEYFKRDSYLKVDNKPVLFIYRPEYLVDDLGGVPQVRQALDKAREACRQAGFDGLLLLGEYRGTDPRPLQLMVDEGLDYAFQYCWPVGGDPAPDVGIKAQEDYWQAWKTMDVIPFVTTLTMGWDSTPWHPTFSAWRLPPQDFQTLCERGKAFVQTLPETSLGRRMVLLDNWNEFGEGHYIAPHRQYGFGYLDAVRNAFTDAPGAHVDLAPEDVGLGPYDRLFAATLTFEEARVKRVTAPEGDAPGLLAWWTFDEDDADPVALDWSGHGLGGMLRDAQRVEGRAGKALLCQGGCVEVPPRAFVTPTREMSLECWIRTEVPNQSDKWCVNCLYGTGETGFRLGLSGGKLSFAIPKTAWSHHLVADAPVPLGQWVHVLATYDGRTMRVYQDGRLCASLERGGRINPTETHLCLGSYDVKHRAYFDGLLDDVRIWAKTLEPKDLR